MALKDYYGYERSQKIRVCLKWVFGIVPAPVPVFNTKIFGNGNAVRIYDSVCFGVRKKWRMRMRLGISLGIAIIVFIAFSPTLENGFVSWDDRSAFLENPHYRGLTFSHVQWMFTTFHQGHYQPLSWVTLGLDYTIYGMNPIGYHLTSLLLHIMNSILLYFLIMSILGAIFGEETK
jgi:hypothetical protein